MASSSKFTNCIVSVKTRDGKRVIGTVKVVKVGHQGEKEDGLLLGDAVIEEGEAIVGKEKELLVRSSTIADLQVIGVKKVAAEKGDNYSSSGSSSDDEADEESSESSGEKLPIKPKPLRGQQGQGKGQQQLPVDLLVHCKQKQEEAAPGADILRRTFGGLSLGGGGGVPSPGVVGLAALAQGQATTSVAATSAGTGQEYIYQSNIVKKGKSTNFQQQGQKSQNQQNHHSNARSNNSRKIANDHETFSNTVVSTQEFDFEENNKLFCKLPTTIPPPAAVAAAKKKQKELEQQALLLLQKKQCTNNLLLEETTPTADRRIPSTMVLNKNTNYLFTDTGIAVPTIDLTTRSKILNLANDVGVSHERTLSTYSHSIAQLCLQQNLLGDPFLLSPERNNEDRPKVLILAGGHWQGSTAIATARLLKSLNVWTYVHCPKEELFLCLKEERLYKMCFTDENMDLGFGRRIEDIPLYQYNTIIFALDDPTSKTLTMAPYNHILTANRKANLLFIDPPILQNPVDKFRIPEHNRKVLIVSPVLPLDHRYEPGVKHIVVNLGIPHGVFLKEGVRYKGFFSGSGSGSYVPVFYDKNISR